MAWFPALRAPDRLHELRREAKQIIWDLLDVEVPIVCALNGPAVGLGASIALLCDVIVMADTRGDPRPARPGRPRRRRRRRGDLAAAARAARGQAPPDARRPARRRRGAPARAWPPRSCPADDVASTCRGWADRLAAQPPLAVQGTKIAVNAQIKQALLTSFDLSTALEIGMFPLRRPRRSGRRVRRRSARPRSTGDDDDRATPTSRRPRRRSRRS